MPMTTSNLFRTILPAGLALFLSLPATADCSDTYQSCNVSCESSMTSGFIVGLAGALGRNNAAYQQGQRELQQAQACSERCSSQLDSCTTNEQNQRSREDAMRRTEQQRLEAQQRAAQQQAEAQERARVEHEQLKRRANRIISPPVTAPLAIKDAAPLLQLAQAHLKDGNQSAASLIYKMVIQGSTQPKHQQAARSGLKPMAIEQIIASGTGKPSSYQRILDEYEQLGVFSGAEHRQLQALAPVGGNSEIAASEYLRKTPKGALREIAEMVVQAGPRLRALDVAEQKRIDEEKNTHARLESIKSIPRNQLGWIPAKGGCLVHAVLLSATVDATWSGNCTDSKASGKGIFRQLGANGELELEFEGSLVAGELSGQGVLNIRERGRRYQGEFRNSLRHGSGTLHFDSGATYEGEFANNNFHGKGVMTWPSGSRYTGEFFNGNRTGQGTYLWADGARHQGAWVDGNRQGHGTFWYAGTDYFVGEWVDNKEFNGTLYENGGRVKATYSNGQRTDK